MHDNFDIKKAWRRFSIKSFSLVMVAKVINFLKKKGQFGQMVECSFKNEVVLGLSPVAVDESVFKIVTYTQNLHADTVLFLCSPSTCTTAYW